MYGEEAKGPSGCVCTEEGTDCERSLREEGIRDGLVELIEEERLWTGNGADGGENVWGLWRDLGCTLTGRGVYADGTGERVRTGKRWVRESV